MPRACLQNGKQSVEERIEGDQAGRKEVGLRPMLFGTTPPASILFPPEGLGRKRARCGVVNKGQG
ncbi:hypothetical protein DB347_12975 [Opitutaceae bacterium EW11]|nr:hypothetical protein DB347_12975 [Opitutaceae bacterium EW11]